MADPQKPVSSCRSLATLLVVALGSLGAGCVSLGELVSHKDEPPTGAPCHVVVRWISEVAHAPDPARGGAQAPGLVGRLYLFDQKIDYPLGGDGELLVELYDLGQPGPGGEPGKLIEKWYFDPANLQRLMKKDAIGWGYSLFLPWGTYRPDIVQVKLKVAYRSLKGTPLYSESGLVQLTSGGALPTGLNPSMASKGRSGGVKPAGFNRPSHQR